MFEELSNLSIETAGHLESVGYIEQTEKNQRDAIEARITHENTEALAELQQGITALGVPEIVSNAQQELDKNPLLNGVFDLQTTRVDLLPNSPDLEAVTAPVDRLITEPELRAMSGFVIRLYCKGSEEMRQTQSRWLEPSGMSNGYFVQSGDIIYVLGFTHGTRDKLMPARWSITADPFNKPKKPTSTGYNDVLWNSLGYNYMQQQVYERMIRRRRALIPISLEAVQEMHRDSDNTVYPNPEFLKTLNQAVELPTKTSILRRNRGGGFIGSASEPFLPNQETVELYRTELASKLEARILANPVVTETKSQ